ncbi:MAG: dihydrodipicolinate synthase family protein [Spirochaetales bacterium]
MTLDKYKGVIPAFYGCYDDEGAVSAERTRAFTKYLIEKGVHGVYVCGSSGECIYQTVEERKLTLENVMAEAKGKITVIAHVACNDIAQSKELAIHAESLGVDAIACIPPIYFKLPDSGIARFWNEISAVAPKTDFIIYNIPQLAGVALSASLFGEMLKNPRVIGVKNSSMPVMDIQIFKDMCKDDHVVFNGPDEQFICGLAMGADGGIGGTYGAMPELYLKMFDLMKNNEVAKAREIQYAVNNIIFAMCSCKGNMYAIIKEVLRRNGMNIGTVRRPLAHIENEDEAKIDACEQMIKDALKKYA